MHLADRYAALLAGSLRGSPHLRDEPASSGAGNLSEIEIQARWFAGEFGREFHSTAGRALRVVQFGVWNREAGPDFAEAAVSFDGGEPVPGSIELDMDARDWERHGHATNELYENVVLHVFLERGDAAFFTRTQLHHNVPQLLLDLRTLEHESLNSQPIAKPGRCVAPLRILPSEKVREILDAAAQFRLQKKAARLARLREAHGADEALYQALAETLGYKSNKLPFTLLAQRLPLRILRTEDRPEALLFGVSGFLPKDNLAQFEPQTRGYLRELWQKWWSRRAAFERLEVGPDRWRMSGQRPANHPQRRIAALAQIVKQWPKVRNLAERSDAAEIRKFFAALHDEYWDFHYTLSSRPSSARMALVGETRMTEMLVNAFFPLAILADAGRWESYRKLPAKLSNKRVEIAAIRLFGNDDSRKGELLKTAAHQQGLLQIYEDFCMHDHSDCINCPFPQQLEQWR